MKFYSYTNKNYTKVICLSCIRSIEKLTYKNRKGKKFFSIRISYFDNRYEKLIYLEETEFKKAFEEILFLINN